MSHLPRTQQQVVRDQRRGPLHPSPRGPAPATRAQYGTEMLGAEGAAQLADPHRWVLLPHPLKRRRQWPSTAGRLGRYLPARLPRAQRADSPHVALYRPRPQCLTLSRDVPGPAASDEFGEKHQRLKVVSRAPGVGGIDEGLALRGLREVAKP
eukprot:4904829-Pleurochrysis_carterae.AAC.1